MEVTEDDDLSCDSVDYPGSVLDEIALEGLDGLTIEGLWQRLATRKPAFAFIVDENTKDFLWDVVRQLAPLEFYLLPEPRPPLHVFDRFAHDFVDPDTGLITDDEDRQDIYPFLIVDDGEIRGSCATYKTRKLLSVLDIRAMPLDLVTRKYGNSLVMVANQRARNIALTGNHPVPVKLSAVQYAMIERIGRGRESGETTQGNLGLIKTMDLNAKSMFHVRKLLLKHELMCKQDFSVRSKKGINLGGRLLHLPRFYFRYLPKAERAIRAMADVLRTLPKWRMPQDELFERLGFTVQSMKKTVKSATFKKHLKFMVVPYRDFYPDALKSKYMTKGMTGERRIKLLEMISDPDEHGNDDEDDEEVPDGDDDDDAGVQRGFLDKSNFVPNRHLHDQAILFAETKGAEGASMSQFEQSLGLSKLDARCIVRKLHKRKDLVSVAVSRGRQKVNKYVSKYLDQSTLTEKDGELSMRTQELETLKAVVEKQKAAIASLECNGVLPVRSCQEWDSEESAVGLDSASPHVTDVSSPVLMDMSLPHIMELSQDVKRGGLLNIRIQKIVEDRLEVIVERDEAGGKKKHPVEDDNKKGLMSEDMTGLNMRRARQILEYLDSKKLVPLYFVHKWLKKREQDEGSAQTVDRKSLLNLLAKMEREGLIKCLKTTYEWLSQARQCTFVVHASFPTDPRSLETRLNAEEMSVDMSMLRGGDGEMSAVPVPDGLMEYWSVRGPQMGSKVKDNQQEDVKPTGEKSRGSARKSGTVPKFQRSFLLHQLVYYITHAYEGDPSLDQSDAWAAINQELRRQHGPEQVLSEEAIQQMPRLYKRELSWKMFLPPLLSHPSWLTTDGEPVPNGWLMLCEVIVRLPLSQALQLINVKDPTFESDYFTHPVKKFVPVLRSEETVRLHLFQGRVFIQRMVDNMSILAAMGLVQIGKRLTSQSDTNFYYVNHHATIVDTRAAKECYNQISSTAGFERHSYQFTDMEALEEYWQHLQIISLDTKMGSLNAKDEESKNVVSLSKNSSMKEVWVPVDFSDAPRKDVGKIPGNGKGAAGLDSSMFVHLMRSWFPPEGKEPIIREPNILTAKADPRRLSVCPPEIQVHVPDGSSDGPERRSTRHAPASREPEVADEPPPAKKKKVAKKRGRQSTATYDAPGMEEEDTTRKKSDPKKRKHGGKNSVVHYEDEMDRSIAQRSVSRRAKWTYEETTILTMCKAAIDLVTEDLRKTLADQSLNPVACRNVLHDYVRDSDKTVPPIFRWFRSLRNKPKVAQMALIYASFLKRCAEARLIVEQLAPITTAEEGKEAVEQVLAPLVEILHREFILSADGDGVSSLDLPTDKLPPTLEEFWQQYVIDDFCNKRVESYKTPPVVSEADIQMAAASTVLMTSLCSRADKKGWAVHLFKIYNDYTPSMLRKILHQFQHLRICARIKFKRRVNKRLSVMQLPLTASSYRLSARFNDKFRVSAFRYELFEEVGEALGAVLGFASKGRNYFDVTPFSHGGLASVMTALTSAGLANVTAELPDREIITYEKRSIDFPKKDGEELSSNASSSKLPGSGDKAIHRAGSQAYFSSRKDNSVAALLSDVSFQSGSSSPSGSQCSSSMGPPGTPPLSISPTKSFKRSASKVACASHRRRLMAQAQMPMDPEDEEARISRNVKVHVSRLFFALGAPVEANQESPGTVRNFEMFLPNPIRDEVLRLHHAYVRRDSSDPRDLFEACRKEGVGEHDIRRMKEIFRIVKEEGVMGLTLPALKAKLSSRDASRPPPPLPSDAISLRLGQLLRLLLRYQQLWLVGSHDLRFVVNEYVKTWMVKTFKMTRLEQENAGTTMEQIKAKADENNRRNKGHIVGPGGDDPANMAEDVAASRDVETFTSKLVSDARQFHTMLFPWTHVDGTLNRRVLDRMLGSVLAHLMDKPGQTIRMIADHFDPYLTPRHTYELLTILDRLACIRATVMSAAPQENTIFTPVDRGTWRDDDVTEDVEADDLIYEPAIDATIRLGAFVAQREYSKPFLSLSEKS